MEDVEILETQTCLTCGLLKNIAEFSKAKGKINGKIYRRNKCKQCINTERKERQGKNKKTFENLKTINQITSEFTENDIQVLKIIIQKFKDQRSSKQEIKLETQIINELLNNNYKKVNKTYSIYCEISKLIEDFCDEKRMFFSDFIMVSAIEYINKNKDF